MQSNEEWDQWGPEDDMLHITNFLRDEEGATAVEYGLLAALIAAAIIASVTLLGGNVAAIFTQVANAI
jgi:pilus assembly protein Flp/PilA